MFHSSKLPLLVLSLNVLLGSISAYAAPEDDLNAYTDVLTRSIRQYERSGDDNNSAELKLNPQYPLSNPPWTKLHTATALEHALRDCVFIPQGAYGDHMTVAQSTALARKTSRDLLRVAKKARYQPLFYRVEGWKLSDAGVFHANCTLYIDVDRTFSIGVNAYTFD